MSFNCKGELGWSINKISHGDNKQENKSNKNNWGKNNLFRHTSPTVPPWELGRRKISVSLKTPSRWKIFYQYQVSNSNLIKKFTFIDALVINISMRSFDQVKGQIKKMWNDKNHVFMLKTRAPSHCQTSARSTASPCTWRGGKTRLLLPWIFPFLHKWGMGRLDTRWWLPNTVPFLHMEGCGKTILPSCTLHLDCHLIPDPD